MNEDLKNNLARNGLFFGLLLGGVGVFFYMTLYLFNQPLMVKWWMGLLRMALMIGLAVFAAMEIRKRVGGYWNFSEALKAVLPMLLVASLMGSFFQFALFNWIDPDLPAALTEQLKLEMINLMEGLAVPPEDMDEALKAVEADSLKMNFGQWLGSFGWSAIVDLVLAAVLALIVKKSEVTDSAE